MRHFFKCWTKDKIIYVLQNLKPINGKLRHKDIIKYHNIGLICHISTIHNKFGSLINALKEAGLSNLICLKDERYKIFSKERTFYNKENLVKILQDGYKEFGVLSPTELIFKINKKDKIDIRSALKKFFGSTKNALKEAGVKYKNYYWTNEMIIKQLQQLYLNDEIKYRSDINHLKKGKLCRAKLIRDRFGSLDNVAKYANIKFDDLISRVNEREKIILDQIELEKGIKLERQYRVGNKFIDGFDTINNIAYEVDEKHHKLHLVEDFLREQQIKEKLNCDFIRIKLYN